MTPIQFIDRKENKICIEKVFGDKALKYLYGDSPFGKYLRDFLAKNSFTSSAVGCWFKQPFTKRKIAPFIKEYGIDPNEFLLPIEAFRSFNDFFIRELKHEVRPIDLNPNVAVIPADARYWFYQEIEHATPFQVKEQSFDLPALFQNDALANQFSKASLAIARLCPSDYHRFHFPVDGIPSASVLINGPLYSVNPLAIKKNLSIFWENKRCFTLIETEKFGTVAYFEIGATSVGTIHETYHPNQPVAKGAEKGYFSFGGSSLLILFEKGKIQFCEDLLETTKIGLEIRCLLGQPMGKAPSR